VILHKNFKECSSRERERPRVCRLAQMEEQKKEIFALSREAGGFGANTARSVFGHKPLLCRSSSISEQLYMQVIDCDGATMCLCKCEYDANVYEDALRISIMQEKRMRDRDYASHANEGRRKKNVT
jgi:hypothetical protein